jgi:hypothetical protein
MTRDDAQATSGTPGMWGERRAEVVGRATCTIPALPEPVTVRDLSLSGFVLETKSALQVGSTHACDFRFDGRVVRTSARVTERRYRPAVETHTVAFAFRLLTQKDAAAIERLAGTILGFSGAQL